MKLILLYLDNRVEKFNIARAFQDRNIGMGKLYYETLYNEHGKGQFINTEDLRTWEIEP